MTHWNNVCVPDILDSGDELTASTAEAIHGMPQEALIALMAEINTMPYRIPRILCAVGLATCFKVIEQQMRGDT